MRTFFDECNQHFYDPNPSFSDDILSFSTNANANTNTNTNGKYTLQVMNVGSYDVSVAQCFNDLMRVDKSVFVLNNELIDVLKKYYSLSFWGFIVCKLKKVWKNIIPWHILMIFITEKYLFQQDITMWKLI